jgi:CheY-like chemotaxis protein
MVDDKIKVVLAEDDPGDTLLFEEALQETGFYRNVDLVKIKDGKKVINYLFEYEDVPPHVDLLVLDLNLPKVNGHEILNRIRTSEEFKYLPVVILTTSDSSSDIHISYTLGVNSYVSKPINIVDFESMLSSFFNFWLVHNKYDKERK